jgi:hypothetical protein
VPMPSRSQMCFAVLTLVPYSCNDDLNRSMACLRISSGYLPDSSSCFPVLPY